MVIKLTFLANLERTLVTIFNFTEKEFRSEARCQPSLGKLSIFSLCKIISGPLITTQWTKHADQPYSSSNSVSDELMTHCTGFRGCRSSGGRGFLNYLIAEERGNEVIKMKGKCKTV